jgi:hypothetical protein
MKKYKISLETEFKKPKPQVFISVEQLEKLYLEMKIANSKNWTKINGFFIYLEKY